MRSFSCLLLGLVVALAVGPAASTLGAQQGRRPPQSPSALLDAYSREFDDPRSTGRASMGLTQVLTHHAEHPAGDVETVLAGLERMAIGGSTSRLRAEAAASIAIPGSRKSTRPLGGTFARLARVYRSSDDPVVRSIVVGAMGGLSEHRAAVPFLEHIAKQQDEEFAGAAGKALTSLLMLGDPGRPALERLHSTSAVKNPEARQILATMVKNGYRLPQ